MSVKIFFPAIALIGYCICIGVHAQQIDDEASRIPRIAQSPSSTSSNTARTVEQIEDEFWNSVRDSTDRADFELYLAEYPKGRYAALARLRISKLSGGESRSVGQPGAQRGDLIGSIGQSNVDFRLRLGDVLTYRRTVAEFGEDRDREIKLAVTSVGRDGAIEFDGKVRYRGPGSWDETSSVEPIFDGFPPLRRLAFPLVQGASWNEDFEVALDSFPMPYSTAAGHGSNVSIRRNVTTSINVDVYIAGFERLPTMLWAGDVVRIEANTRYRSIAGQTTSKATLWYSPAIQRYVRIHRARIFPNTGVRQNMGLWSQELAYELVSVQRP